MDPSHPFREICDSWLSLIKEAEKQRDEEFGKFARETEKLFDSDHNWMWDSDYSQGPDGYLKHDGQVRTPTFRITINKVSDAVDLYGPSLMHRYPQVVVSPVRQSLPSPSSLQLDPQDQNAMMQYESIAVQRQEMIDHRDTVAEISQSYLNWLQVETGKKATARACITDAIVSGVGLAYTELAISPTGRANPRNRHIRWEDYVKDPDAKANEDTQMIAVRRRMPLNHIEQKFGLPPGSLKNENSDIRGQARGRKEDRESKSFEQGEFWEVYSKNGFGARLKNLKSLDPTVRQLVEEFGDYAYVAVMKDIPYPLNIPPEALATEDFDSLMERAHWPIPTYRQNSQGDDWPVSELSFRINPKKKWPMSLFKPLIGEIMFVNWVMSFIGDKVAQHATDYLGVLKEAADDIQEQLSTQSGPFQLLKIDSTFGRRIDDVVSILNKPDFSGELWKIVSETMDIIEKGSGVTELMYGSTSRQMRSSAEAQLLGGNTAIRPDDMADKTDDWYAQCSMKEWLAAVWLLEPEDVQDVLGPEGAWIFTNRIQVEEFASITGDYHYRLVANSARKPNKGHRLDALMKFAQIAMPMWEQYIQLGEPAPYNAFVEESAKALEIEDYERFVVPTERLMELMQAAAEQAQQEQGQADEQEAVLKEEEFQREQVRRDKEQAARLWWQGRTQETKIGGQQVMNRMKAVQELIKIMGDYGHVAG